MKNTIFGILSAVTVVFASQFTQAGLLDLCMPCDEVAVCNPCDGVDYCGPIKAGKWFLNGHIEAGFFANGHGQKSSYTGAAERLGRGADDLSGNTHLLENTRLTGGQVNQIYLSLGRSVDGKRGLEIGGKIDATWGSDAYIVQAKGKEYASGHSAGRWGVDDYFGAIPQAYAEVAFKRWNVKAGQFYAPFGSETFKSTDRFFYSMDQASTFMPHVASGAYATYALSDTLSICSGWVVPGEFGESGKYNTVLGGLDWNPSKRMSFRYAFAAGTNTYANNDFGSNYNLFVHSLKAHYQLSKRLKYDFEWNLLNLNINDGGGNRHTVYAINHDIIYQHNRKWALGARFGMVYNDADDSADLPFYLPAGDWLMVSLGANWTPNKWLTVKPEVRYDWMMDAAATPFNNETNTYQVSGGLSAVVKF